MSAAGEEPPAYLATINQIKLDTRTDSSIVNVNLYRGHAEISRLYKLKLVTGQNNVVITGLPNALNEDNLRVEGRGDAAIHDVTTFIEPAPAPISAKDSPKIRLLYDREAALNRSLRRSKDTIKGLEKYLSTLSVERVDAQALLPTLAHYNAAVEQYDESAAKLKQELQIVDRDIKKEKEALNMQQVKGQFRRMRTVTVSVSAPSEGDAELVLIYGVAAASWTALYDVRVSTETKEAPVQLAYKATIRQDTGEDWTDVPVTLETSAPTFGLQLPELTPSYLSVLKARPAHTPLQPQPMIICQPQMPTVPIIRQRTSSSRSTSPSLYRARSWSPPPVILNPPPAFYVPPADVASQGRVNASFKVPGLITIPSDGVEHKVTIANLVPQAELSWFCIPSVDKNVHLTTKVKNTSAYTLLPGPSSVYVDGSFISKSKIPLVSPEESFACPLGLDPSIKVTYHPQTEKISQSGLITKTSSTSFSQRIAIHNAKSIPVAELIVVDQIPVSDDSQISVRLLNPSLGLPKSISSEKLLKDSIPQVTVSSGVVAQWYAGHGLTLSENKFLGENGMISWTCILQPQAKIDLSLAWEVSAPVQVDIIGF